MALVAAGGELDHMAEVVHRVVHWRRREIEDLLGAAATPEVVLQKPVAGRSLDGDTGDAGIAEIVRLIDDHRVGIAHGHLDLARPLAVPLQVGVVVDDQVDKAAEHSLGQRAVERYQADQENQSLVEPSARDTPGAPPGNT